MILATLFAAACGGAAVFPEVFSQERADGKIPVSIELIRKQTQKEMGGMPEKQATAERWREIEADYNACRLSSARQTKAEADKVFANCMSRKGYVYMLRLDAEQLHDEIAAEEPTKYAAEKKAAEEARLAAEEKTEQDKKNYNLISWARKGDVAKIRALLAAGANPNAVDEKGRTALMGAAYKGNAEIAKALLDAGANPNAAKNNKDTALMYAAGGEYSEVAKMLLDAGANPNAVNDEGGTALVWAVEQGYSEIAKMLLDAGANPSAAQNDGWTALMWVAHEGYSEIAKMLLDAGANPDAVRDDGWVALMLAAGKGHAEITEALLADSANPNAVSKDGWTSLMLAVNYRHPEIAKMLLDAGANPNTARDDGETALIMAANYGGAEVAKALLDSGASPNAAKDDGVTALMYSAYNGHPEVAKVLLDAGAYPNAGDAVSKTALIYSALKGYIEVAKVLLSGGANPNAKDNDDWTALIVAAEKEKPEVARILLACGANPNVKNRHGVDAWYWAKRHPIILPIFQQHIAEVRAGKRVGSCKGRWDNFAQSSGGSKVATTKPPSEANVAEAVFENVWRSVVVVKQGGSQGSGVIVRPNVVATNCHVVDSYGDIVIYKHDNRRATTDTTFNAVVDYRDDDRDFCLLDVSGLQGKPAKVRLYDTLNIGEDVYAVGSPKGLDLSLSSGIISQLRLAINARFIQTDAAISPGSSGGGLFDSNGNLIGILTRKIADEDVEGIGFAIPSDLVLGL